MIIASAKPELLALGEIRTEYDQSKVLEKNETLRGEISNKDLLIKIVSESLSQITNYFNKSNNVRHPRPQRIFLLNEMKMKKKTVRQF